MADLFGDVPHKRCIDCKVSKPLADFYRQRSQVNGRFYFASWCRPCAAARARRRNAQPHNKARLRAAERKARYGMTQAEFDAIFVAQGGVCAICKKPETSAKRGAAVQLAVDHSHSPPHHHRGLLCSRCNPGIGFFNDDPALLRAAADYLEAHPPPDQDGYVVPVARTK